MDAVDQVGDGRMILQDGEAAHDLPFRVVYGRGDAGHQVALIAFARQPHRGSRRLCFRQVFERAGDQTGHAEKNLPAVLADGVIAPDADHGLGAQVQRLDAPVPADDEGGDVELVEDGQPILAGNGFTRKTRRMNHAEGP